MTRSWQGSWQWVCVAEAVMACGYKCWLRAREPGVSMGTAGGCSEGSAGSAATAPAQVGAALAGDLQVPGWYQLVLSAKGVIPTQPNPRALLRDAALNR